LALLRLPAGHGGQPGERLVAIVARAIERGELAGMPRSYRVLNLAFDLLRHDEPMTMRAAPNESIVDDVWLPLQRGSAGDTPGTEM